MNIGQSKNYIILLSFFAFLFLLCLSKMSPIYYTNEWSDINVYFNVAKGMANGSTLYTEVFDHKGPLIFFIYELGYLISHKTFTGIFILQVITWSLLLSGIFFTARLFVKDGYAFLTSLLFSIALVNYTKTGGSAEEFVLAFESIGLLFFLRYFLSPGRMKRPKTHLFILGALCSAILFIKINLIVFLGFLVIAIFLDILFQRRYKDLLINLSVFIAGLALVAIPIYLYFYTKGALSYAFDTYIVLNKTYSEVKDYSEIIPNIAIRIYRWLTDDPIVMILSFTGLFYFPGKFLTTRTSKVCFITGGIFLFFMIFMFEFFHKPYYPIPFLIFNYLGLIVVIKSLSKYINIPCTTKTLIYLIIGCLLVGISSKHFFKTSRSSYDLREFASVIKQEENPTLLNLGFSIGNSLFTVCNIVPNVKYFFTPNLVHEKYPELRNEQSNYIQNKDTEFVLLISSSLNFNYFWKLPALRQNYTLIKTKELGYNLDAGSIETFYLFKRKE